MPNQVLVYSRFPKAMMLRIGERFELMDAAGKPPHEVFSAEQLSGVSAMITRAARRWAGDDGQDARVARDHLLRHRL